MIRLVWEKASLTNTHEKYVRYQRESQDNFICLIREAAKKVPPLVVRPLRP